MANKTTRILCIEDEADIRELIVEELSFEGYEVLQAVDGQQGLNMIVSEKPDLVICDISMPRLTGYEVLSTLRLKHEELAGIPFIFLSALSQSIEVEVGYQFGADDYLTKPVDFDELQRRVKAALDRPSRRISDIGKI